MIFEDVPRPILKVNLGKNRTITLPTTTILIAVLIVGGILRFAALGRWSLWFDELYNLGLMPVSALLAQGFPADQHPPLYYLVLEQALKVGRSEWLMRLPSALAGFLTIPIMWRIGTAVKRPDLGLLAAALLAFAPLHVWYSREARMYALAMLFWTAALYFYIQSWQRDNWFDTLGLVLTMTGGLYTAYPTLALWFIQIALSFLVWKVTGGKTTRLFRWAAAQLAIAALFYPWRPFLARQLERAVVFDWLNLFNGVLGPEAAVQLNQWLEKQGLATTLAGTFQLAAAAGLLFILVSFLISLSVTHRRSTITPARRPAYLIATAVVFIFLGTVIAGAIPRGLSLRRQLLVFWIPLLIIAAWAVLRLKKKWVIPVVAGISLLLSSYTAFGPPYEDWRSAANIVRENGRPGEMIFMTPSWSTAAFDYYYEGDLPYSQSNPQHAQENEAAFNQAGHIWLVVNRHPSMAEITAETENWFVANGRLLETHQFPQYLTVYKFEFGEMSQKFNFSKK